MKEHETCPFCNNEIDRDICWCGMELEEHKFIEDHFFVPIGCDYYRIKENIGDILDSISQV